MACKVVKYRLESNGTVPTYVKTGTNMNTSGMFAVRDATHSSPEDNILVGITNDGADISGAIEEFTSEAALQTYLEEQSQGNNWTQPSSLDPDERVPFDPASNAQRVWDTLNILNG